MKTENIIQIKSFEFANRIVNLYHYLCSKKHEYVMSKQLLRCGTSIGANVFEALRGQSRADFGMKLTISLKEASETEYWLLLLRSTNYLTQREADSMLNDCRQIIKILMSINKTLYANASK